MIKDNGDMFHHSFAVWGAQQWGTGWTVVTENMGEVDHFSTVRLEEKRVRRLGDEAEREGGGTETVEGAEKDKG